MGVVKAVDTDARTFTLTVKEVDKTFKYTDATKFMVGKETKTAADVLVVGSKVGVMATDDTATVVKTLPAGGKKKNK